MRKIVFCALSFLLFCAAALAEPLGPGAAGEEIARLQKRLCVLGYYEGEATGVYDEKTLGAVSRLQAFFRAGGAADYAPAKEGEADAAFLACAYDEKLPTVLNGARPGDTSENVLRMQRRLNALGYLHEKADGLFGKNTLAALRVFQFESGLPILDWADEASLNRLFSEAAASAAYPALSKGMKGERVAHLQRRLLLLGFQEDGVADGQYGRETAEAVKNLQACLKELAADSATAAALLPEEPDGVADPYTQRLFYGDSFPVSPGALAPGDEGQRVYRLQRRLILLGYLTAAPDGGYGEETARAVEAFSAQNGAKGAALFDRLFSSEARAAERPYQIRVSLKDQTLTVYARDKKGNFSVKKSTMPCSTGAAATPTPAGSYTELTKPGKEWVTLADGLCARYPFRVTTGLLIRSVAFDKKGGAADRAQLRQLGSAASEGDILLSEENAYLIWSKCKKGTEVIIEDA